MASFCNKLTILKQYLYWDVVVVCLYLLPVPLQYDVVGCVGLCTCVREKDTLEILICGAQHVREYQCVTLTECSALPLAFWSLAPRAGGHLPNTSQWEATEVHTASSSHRSRASCLSTPHPQPPPPPPDLFIFAFFFSPHRF